MQTIFVIVLTGRSSSGKSTFVEYLKSNLDELQSRFKDQDIDMQIMKEYTTRCKRRAMEDDYEFISEKNFRRSLENDTMITHIDTPMGLYGIGADALFPSEKNISVRFIPSNIASYAQLCNYVYNQGEKYKNVSIVPIMVYFYVPNDVLLKRSLDRLTNISKGHPVLDSVIEAKRRYEMETEIENRDPYLHFNPYILMDTFQHNMTQLIDVYNCIDPNGENKILELNTEIRRLSCQYYATLGELYRPFHVDIANMSIYPYNDDIDEDTRWMRYLRNIEDLIRRKLIKN